MSELCRAPQRRSGALSLHSDEKQDKGVASASVLFAPSDADICPQCGQKERC